MKPALPGRLDALMSIPSVAKTRVRALFPRLRHFPNIHMIHLSDKANEGITKAVVGAPT